MTSSFCKSCNMQVGPIVKRPIATVWILSIAAVLSFIFMIMISMPTQGELYFGVNTALSDWWLLIPIILIGFAIKSYLSKSVLCPVCNLELDEE
jgi:hypothetical protein